MLNRAIQFRELLGVRVGLASDSHQQRHYVQAVLEGAGLKVVMNEPLSELFITKIEAKQIDVLVVDVDATPERAVDFLDRLLERSSVPIVFNDVSGLNTLSPAERVAGYGKLLRKIAELTGRPLLEAASTPAWPLAASMRGHRPAEGWAHDALARNVWVLGASQGGLQAVKSFLGALPTDLPVAFILAQHLGASFVGLLAEQLDRGMSFQVIAPKAGHVLRHGQVVVAPVDERLLVNPIGSIELHPVSETTTYSPSINQIIADVAARYGAQAGAIIFSGMGDDGVSGCRELAARGGQVWAQDAASCEISSMPDKVRASGVVGYSGAPPDLARRVVAYLNEQMGQGI